MLAEELLNLKGRELRAELVRLRGARTFTTHFGLATLGKKKGRRRKNEEEAAKESKRKKIVTGIFLSVLAWYVYENFFA